MWKDIDGYPSYRISDDGEVWSKRQNKIMQQRLDGNGYPALMLRENGKRSFVRVHRLVAAAFIQNQNGYPQINHIDEDKTNNSASNLEWCTNEYNEAYGTRAIRSAKNHMKQIARVSENGRVVIFESIRAAAAATGCGTTTIDRCLKTGKISKKFGFGFSYV